MMPSSIAGCPKGWGNEMLSSPCKLMCVEDGTEHVRGLSHSIPLPCRPWWRRWTTFCSHRLWMRGGTWMQANSSAQPPSYSTPWRTVPSCWLITCWRQTSSGKTLTTSVRDRSHKYREQPKLGNLASLLAPRLTGEHMSWPFVWRT